MYAIPMCKMCGEFEVSSFQAHNDFCSDMCADKAYEFVMDAAAVFEFRRFETVGDDYNEENDE